MKFICEQCKKEFIPIKSGYWKKRKFCSHRCVVLYQTGKKRPEINNWLREKRKGNLGKKFTIEHRKNISNALKGKPKPWNKGENNISWLGGKTKSLSFKRQTIDGKKIRKWRKELFKSNPNICVRCGSEKELTSDHIKPYAIYPELRYKITNGQILCKKCHRIKNKEDSRLIWKITHKYEYINSKITRRRYRKLI